MPEWNMDNQRIKKARFIKTYRDLASRGKMASKGRRVFGLITLKELKKRFHICDDTANTWAKEAKEGA